MSASPFAPGVTLANIDERIASGAQVQLVEDPIGTEVLPLASVNPDGMANLQPGSRSVEPQDTTIALVNNTNNAEQQPDPRYQ